MPREDYIPPVFEWYIPPIATPESKQKILIFDSQEILDRIGATPIIKTGVGAVLVGDPVRAGSGRVAISHPFAQIDLDWIEAYTGATIVEELPADFVQVHP
jgi:hypothetical protein